MLLGPKGNTCLGAVQSAKQITELSKAKAIVFGAPTGAVSV